MIDIPILDTRNIHFDLFSKFIADLLFQLLSFVAEDERNNIKQHQAEGIKIAKLNGVKFGRPSFRVTSEFIQCIDLYEKEK